MVTFPLLKMNPPSPMMNSGPVVMRSPWASLMLMRSPSAVCSKRTPLPVPPVESMRGCAKSKLLRPPGSTIREMPTPASPPGPSGS